MSRTAERIRSPSSTFRIRGTCQVHRLHRLALFRLLFSCWDDLLVGKVNIPASAELVLYGCAVASDEVSGPLGVAASILSSEANAEGFADGEKE